MSDVSTTLAPELAVSEWFNTPAPLTLRALRGRPVLIHAFQLLCPGCVAESIPQMRRVEAVFAGTDLQVVGLHTVFEHHAAMTPVTLRAFLHEYGIRHPVAVDRPSDASPVPLTMQRFGLRGTPSTVLVGRDGSILHQVFGVEDALAVGARLAMALSAVAPVAAGDGVRVEAGGCDGGRCELPAKAA